MSDDSHGVDQVGLNFKRVLDFVDVVGIPALSYLERGEKTTDERFPGISTSTVSLPELRKHAFWHVAGPVEVDYGVSGNP